MSALAIERLEPVFLEPEPAKITEFGKREMSRLREEMDCHFLVLRDVARLAEQENKTWREKFETLRREGVPLAVTNGLGRYSAQHLIDHNNGKTSFTMPATVGLHLCTTAGSETAIGTDATYTGYAPLAIAGAGWVAATAAQPSVGANASTITFGNCTAGTSTLVSFFITDSTVANTGNILWYGALTSVTISTTQTPPTVAAGALTVSLAGT